MKRFVKRGRTKLPLGRGVSTAGGNVDTAFKVALHDVFQCGHAPFGQYAQGIQHIEYGGCVIGPEKVFVALVQPRIEHSMPAPRGHPCKASPSAISGCLWISKTSPYSSPGFLESRSNASPISWTTSHVSAYSFPASSKNSLVIAGTKSPYPRNFPQRSVFDRKRPSDSETSTPCPLEF